MATAGPVVRPTTLSPERADPIPAPVYRFTAEQYLDFERGADTKHEYYAGAIYAMVGATEPHVLIVTNLVYALRSQLRDRPCKVYSNDLRLKIAATGSYVYPDVMVVCGDVRLSDGHRDMIENPQMVAEVLSPSTERHDRGTKFQHYKGVESLTDYLLISQDARRVEHHARQPDGSWRRTEITGTGGVSLPSIGCELPLDEIYDKVELPV